MRVLHVITGLDLGGAEVMLERLVRTYREASHEVVSLIDLGIVADRIAGAGVRTRALHMRRTPNPTPLLRLARMIREYRPDVVQTWMYHADLIGGLAAKVAGSTKIVWGIHCSTLDRQAHLTTRCIVAALARLSHRVPNHIVCVSRAARTLHVDLGYEASKFTIIPNGFDLEEYRPDSAARIEARQALGVPDDITLIGLVARVEPQKDHQNFIRAAAELVRRSSDVRFLLCGAGATPDNRELARALAQHRLSSRFQLLGRRTDVPRVLRGLDLATLSSGWGEAFPLVIGEAMACGVPCVVTDVGDCAELVGDTGRTVAPRDPVALARAWEELVLAGAEARARMGAAARRRIETSYGLASVAAQYDRVYRRVMGSAGADELVPAQLG
jgi:glycosyltransferase involved in cell wall biosynthesis